MHHLPRRKPIRNLDLYLMLIPVVLYFLVFWLWPLYGIQIAFREFSPVKGFFGSPWVGLKHFERFFRSYYFNRTLINTLGINLYGLLAGFPLSIVLALMFNELAGRRFREFAQVVSYAPSFLSVMVVSGMLINFLSPSTGFINAIISALGGDVVDFLGTPGLFWHVMVWSNIWQGVGFGTVMYTAAITAIPPTYYEAARIDGAGILRRIWHITLPSITHIIVVLLILSLGNLFTLGFEKVLMLQNPLNLEASEVISTYTYKAGLVEGRYSYTTAIGLFNTSLNLTVLLAANHLSKKIRGVSLWG